MNQPQLHEPACLACSSSEQCKSCVRRGGPSSALGRVGRLQFVVVNQKRIDTNMYLAVKPKPWDLNVHHSLLPITNIAAISDEPILDAESVFQSDIEQMGFVNPALLTSTESSLIYRARLVGFHGETVVKVLRPDLLDSRFGHKVFAQESALVSELNHPNIAALYNYGLASYGAPYLVSHFVRGATLRELNLNGTFLDPINLFGQICEALSYAHERNVVHGRLSASKIICQRISQAVFVAKVIDFAVTSALNWQLPFRADSLRVSASPEERFGQDPTRRSDIYSLGYIMYETLTGTAPQYNRSKDPIGFAPLRGVAKLLEPIVMRCLANEPKERYNSAGEVLQDLRDIEVRLP